LRGRLGSSYRRWTWLHDVLDRRVVGASQVLLAHATQHDVVVVEHHAVLVRDGVELVSNVAEPVSQSTRQHRRSVGDLTRDRKVGSFSVEREPVADPFDLPVDKVVDIAEPHSFELPRSPRAHVSEVVPAIDGNPRVRVQLCRRRLVQALQRNVDRTWKMLSGVLTGGEHLDDLRPLLDEMSHAGESNVLGHDPLLSGFTAPSTPAVDWSSSRARCRSRTRAGSGVASSSPGRRSGS